MLLRARIHGSDFSVCDKLPEKWELEARTKSCLEMLKRNKNFMRHEENESVNQRRPPLVV